jgi:hypothetical protein
VPGTPENGLFDAFSESQVEELSLTDIQRHKKGKEWLGMITTRGTFMTLQPTHQSPLF